MDPRLNTLAPDLAGLAHLVGGVSGNYNFPATSLRGAKGEDPGLPQADGEWQPQEAVLSPYMRPAS